MQILQFNNTCNEYGFRFINIISNNSRFGSKWQCAVFYATIVQRWNIGIGANRVIDFGRQRNIAHGSKVCKHIFFSWFSRLMRSHSCLYAFGLIFTLNHLLWLQTHENSSKMQQSENIWQLHGIKTTLT